MQFKRFIGYFCALLTMGAPAFSAATITIVNGDPAGVGMNDGTIVSPVGGNTGTTLGQQRLNVLQAAANKWGATLTSVPTIRVLTTFEALACTATGAVIAGGGATEIFRDLTGMVPGYWYGKALASAIFGADLDPATADIRLRINRNVGNADCLAGTQLYLGLDNNHGTDADLLTYVLHEMAHGLGFQTFTNPSNGAYQSSFPSIFDRFTFDTTLNKSWDQMTNAERVTSAKNTGHLVWTGTNVNGAIASVLDTGVPEMSISAPAGVAGSYLIGTASFGNPLSATPVIGDLMPIAGDGCLVFTAANVLAVNGNIALIDRGGCTFDVKVQNAQNAGAKAVVIVDNVAGSPPPGLGGASMTITIPSVRISLADGNKLKDQLRSRSRSRSGVVTSLGINNAHFQGADSLGRMMLYAPDPFVSGFSVNHFDPSAFPNQLMEPAINGDLTHSVVPPADLTYKLLKDLGWQ